MKSTPKPQTQQASHNPPAPPAALQQARSLSKHCPGRATPHQAHPGRGPGTRRSGLRPRRPSPSPGPSPGPEPPRRAMPRAGPPAAPPRRYIPGAPATSLQHTAVTIPPRQAPASARCYFRPGGRGSMPNPLPATPPHRPGRRPARRPAGGVPGRRGRQGGLGGGGGGAGGGVRRWPRVPGATRGVSGRAGEPWEGPGPPPVLPCACPPRTCRSYSLCHRGCLYTRVRACPARADSFSAVAARALLLSHVTGAASTFMYMPAPHVPIVSAVAPPRVPPRAGEKELTAAAVTSTCDKA